MIVDTKKDNAKPEIKVEEKKDAAKTTSFAVKPNENIVVGEVKPTGSLHSAPVQEKRI